MKTNRRREPGTTVVCSSGCGRTVTTLSGGEAVYPGRSSSADRVERGTCECGQRFSVPVTVQG